MADLRVNTKPDVEDSAARGLTRAARFGYAAKGVVYLMIGWLALRAAFDSGQARDSRGAMSALLEQPFGRVLLGAVAAGLLGYAFWRVFTATVNPEHDKAPKRVMHAGVAVLHFGLAFAAARMAMSNRAQGGSDNQDAAEWTGRLMEQPFGVWLVMGAGIAFGVYGLYQFRRAAKAKLDKQLDFSRLGARHRDWVERTCRFGIAARGVVFLLIAWFLVKASVQHEPGEARGLGGALNSLRDASYGKWLLAAAALGMVSYGIYQLVRARYRVIRTS